MDKYVMRIVMVALLSVASSAAMAGQTPGVASPWNGPWGGGYLNGGAYAPWSNPYVSAGYPVSQPYAGSSQYQPYANNAAPAAPPQYLPGGGYILPPSNGGGILPNEYAQ